MRTSPLKWALIGLLGLEVAEVAVFVAVAVQIGLLAAFVLLFATSFVGLALLRFAGQGQIAQIRVSAAEGDVSAVGGTRIFVAISGILLLLPGFLTDVVGLLLLLPPVQRAVRAALGRALRQRPRPDGVIDLEPGQWKEEDTGRPPRGGPHDELPKP